MTVIKRDGSMLSVPEATINTYTALGSLEQVFYPNGVRALSYGQKTHLRGKAGVGTG